MVVIPARQVTALVGAQAYLLEYKFRAAVVVVGHRVTTLASSPPVVLVVLAVGEIPVLLPPLVELLVMPVLVILAVGQGAQRARAGAQRRRGRSRAAGAADGPRVGGESGTDTRCG